MRTKKRALPLKALLALLIIALGLSLTACFSDEEGEPTPIEGGGGPTASISLSADPESIPADGLSSSAIKAELRDSTGEAVALATSVTFSTNLGVFPNGNTSYTSYTLDDTGVVTVSLRAGTTPGTAEITCQSNHVTQLIQVEFTSYTIKLTADPERIPADGVSSSTITAEVKDAAGEPVPSGTPVDFSTTLGHFINGATTYTVETPDETGVVSVSLIAGTTIGEAVVTVQSSGVTKTVAVFFTGEGVPGDTAWITLTANPESIHANGSSSSAITAELKTSSGDPVPIGTAITFSTTRGSFPNVGITYSTATPDDTGEVTVSLISSTSAGTATVTASSGSVTQSVTVEFTGEEIPGYTASITVSADPKSIPADGASSSAITAELMTSSGGPVSKGTAITFSTTLGRFSNGTTNYSTATPDDTGMVMVSLIAGTVPGIATVKATSAGITQSVTVEFAGEATPSSLSLSLSQPTVKSDNSDKSTITAMVLDSSSAVIEGMMVSFITDGGQLSVASQTTDETGVARTDFSSGTTDRSNRVATITATVSGLAPKTIPVQVVGTTLSLTTDASILEIGGDDTATLTITARDASKAPIYDAQITVTASPAGMIQLAPATGRTDVTGKLQVQVTALTAGTAVVQADGLGATATQNYTIGAIGSVFRIIHPTTDPYSWKTSATMATTGPQTNIAFNNLDPDTITRAAGDFTADGFVAGDQIMVVGSASNDGTYTIDTVAAGTLTLVASDQLTDEAAGASVDPVTVTTGVLVRVNAPLPTIDVEFATTFGAWDGGASKIVVNPVDLTTRHAEAVLISGNAGTANILVSDADDSSTSDSTTVLFSAPSSEAAKIALQANRTVVPPSTGGVTNSATLKATVKNASDQVVGGAPIAFSILNPTGGGEYVSPAIVYTGPDGIAEATFTSGSLSTDSNGVTLRASLVDDPSIYDDIVIIIGGTGGSVVITRGTSIESVNNDTAYRLPMSVQVADSNGNPMTGTIVTLSAWPFRYATGCWVPAGDMCIPGNCDLCCNIYTFYLNEDANRNLILDPGEDIGPPGQYPPPSGIVIGIDPCPVCDPLDPLYDPSLCVDLCCDANECNIPWPNPDGQLTPPNSAAGTVPSWVTTDENGVADFDLVYGKGSAGWIEDEITATTLVYGTETKGTYIFILPWAIADVKPDCKMPDSSYNFDWW